MKIEKKKQTNRRVRSAYFISVVSISLVLLIIGITALLMFNGNRLKKEAEENILMTVYLNEDSSPAEIDRISKQLKVAPFTRSAEYISPETASRIMEDELGYNFTETIGYDALPPSVELHLKPEYLPDDSIASIKKYLQKYSFIKEIFYQKKLSKLINNNIRKLSLTGIIAAALMSLIAYALINNAVRLSVHSKRFVIKTAQLVGGTRSFIRKPFVQKTIIAGIVGASLSSALLAFIVFLLHKNYPEIITAGGIWIIVILVYIAGISITGIAGYFSVNRYLDTDEDQLFYEG